MRSPPNPIKLKLEALAIMNRQKPIRIIDPKNPTIVKFDYYEAGKKCNQFQSSLKNLKI